MIATQEGGERLTNPMERPSVGYPETAEQTGSGREPIAELTALLKQTNRLLSELLAELRGKTAPPIPRMVTQAPPPVPAPWPGMPQAAASVQPEGWMSMVNTAFSSITPDDIRNRLQTTFTNGGSRLIIVDFDDRGAYQQDHSYAKYAYNATGCCFLLSKPGSADICYAYPYPAGQTWFQLGREGLKPLYDMNGDLQSLAPRLQITKPATVRRTDQFNKSGHPIFVPEERGVLIAQS